MRWRLELDLNQKWTTVASSWRRRDNSKSFSEPYKPLHNFGSRIRVESIFMTVCSTIMIDHTRSTWGRISRKKTPRKQAVIQEKYSQGNAVLCPNWRGSSGYWHNRPEVRMTDALSTTSVACNEMCIQVSDMFRGKMGWEEMLLLNSCPYTHPNYLSCFLHYLFIPPFIYLIIFSDNKKTEEKTHWISVVCFLSFFRFLSLFPLSENLCLLPLP